MLFFQIRFSCLDLEVGDKNLQGRKGCPAHDSVELLHNLFQHSMRQETLSRVTEKLRAFEQTLHQLRLLGPLNLPIRTALNTVKK